MTTNQDTMKIIVTTSIHQNNYFYLASAEHPI